MYLREKRPHRRVVVTVSSGEETPKSPETQPEYVKDELDQDTMSHQGELRKAPPGGQPKSGGKHLGAVEDEESPVIPPMSGPADLVGERDMNGQGNETGQTEVGEELFDPRDELTPG
jgi:hypothetical protein